MTPTRPERLSGPLMCVLALLAAGAAGYLAWVHLAGVEPVCAILTGCETVANSEWSTFLGVPVALFGAAGSLATLAASLVWWRHADGRALLTAYLLGLASLPILAWLTYLELFVIHAICIWCVTYAVLVLAGWLVAALTLRRVR